MKRALLVGGAGFIGHHLALALNKNGYQVLVVDGLEVNNLVSLQDSRTKFANREFYIRVLEERLALLRASSISIHVEDARDYQRLNKVVHEFQPDVVFLLAAVAHASRANKDPYSTFDHSFRTLENTLDIVRSLRNPCQLVFFSSSMVYGNFLGKTPNEDTYCDPRNIYGALKLGGEKLALAYSNVFDFPVTIVRPSALYGPRCISRRVLQIFIENALRNKDLVIKGDGQEGLDFTYIDDLVSGLISLTLNPVAYGEVFNITRGQSQSLSTAAKIIQQHFPSVGVTHEPRDVLNPERGSLSIEKASKMLSYSPTHDLALGIDKYVSWYRTAWKFSEDVNLPPEGNE